MDDLLTEYRKTIDNLDDAIIKFLNLRLHYCWFIGKYKRDNNIDSVYDPTREQQIIERLKEKEEFDGLIEAIWPAIFDFAKQIEKSEK